MRVERWRHLALSTLIAVSSMAASGAGCAGAPPTPDAEPAQKSPFPTPDQLEALTRAPAPAAAFGTGVHEVESWPLEAPFPDGASAASFVEASPWGALLEEAARERAGLVVPTAAMHCAARQIGRFQLQVGGWPSASLERFAAARCGVSEVRLRYRTLEAEVAEPVADEAIVTAWREPTEQLIRNSLVGGPLTAGIWFGRLGSRALAVVTAAQREVRVEPIATALGPGEKLEIRGEVLVPTQWIGAIINRGRYGFADCQAGPGVALPRFHFVCEPDPRDASAWVTVSLTPPGRLLSQPGIDLLVWPTRETDDLYRRPAYAPTRELGAADDAGRELAKLVNLVRASAGVPPLVLERAQSEATRELAPHFFSALLGTSPQSVADLAMLGMLAGWHVDGFVQDADFTASWVTASRDLSALLSAALDHPTGRKVLLSADAERIAVGAIVEADAEVSNLGAVYVTYALFSEEEHHANAERVYAKIQAQRAARDLVPPRRLPGVAPLAMEAASRVQAGADPEDVLSALLQASVEVLGRPVSGWLAEVSDLEDLELPADPLSAPDLGVAVGVSVRKPEGEAWGRFVVMIVAAGAESQLL